MTDFWQHMSATREEEQGKSLVDIAAELPQLETFIWAGLPDANIIAGGVYPHVYHWQSKAAVTKYIQEEKPELWATMVKEWPSYDAYQAKTDREIPVVVLERLG